MDTLNQQDRPGSPVPMPTRSNTQRYMGWEETSGLCNSYQLRTDDTAAHPSRKAEERIFKILFNKEKKILEPYMFITSITKSSAWSKHKPILVVSDVPLLYFLLQAIQTLGAISHTTAPKIHSNQYKTLPNFRYGSNMMQNSKFLMTTAKSTTASLWISCSKVSTIICCASMAESTQGHRIQQRMTDLPQDCKSREDRVREQRLGASRPCHQDIPSTVPDRKQRQEQTEIRIAPDV